MSGIVVVDKPAGWTSHDVVGRIRRLAATRKVGHAGTLDPLATGVLVVGVGRATRLLGHLSGATKAYDATIRLGRSTTTDDAEGEPLESTDATGLDRTTVETAAAAFVGDVEQVPSTVSAIKVDGRRAYARARAGESVTLPSRPVHIDDLTVHEVREQPPYVDVDVSVTCSAGTYVRAIARDLGAALDVGGHLTALRRTRSGGFTLADAATLEALERDWQLLSLSEAARRSFPIYQVTPDQAASVRHGRALAEVHLPAAGPVGLIDPAGEFLALYEQRGADARAVAVFVD
ncbi:MAG TPA: tRNA pseudouridine(55) synthase TruB [Nocardioidaceae bacterium]|nr:tRNA pseudouridine(55) synthase TruB [Nocardioidaceae bacterium]